MHCLVLYPGRSANGGAGGVGGLLYLSISNSSTPNSSTRQLYVPWYDAYGNIMGYWDAQGNVVAEYTYDAFGKLIASSGPMADVFAIRYSTKYFDSETGLYYYGYRFYSPELMRWITRDPIGEEGGVNLYAMCGNSVVYSYDWNGMMRFLTRSMAFNIDSIVDAGELAKGRQIIDFLTRELPSRRNPDGTSQYKVEIRDMKLTPVLEIRRAIDANPDDVYLLAHGSIVVNGRTFRTAGDFFTWPRWWSTSSIYEGLDPAANDVVIPISWFGDKLNMSNVFACYLANEVRRKRFGEDSWKLFKPIQSKKLQLNELYGYFDQRLQKYRPKARKKCLTVITVFEGEFDGTPENDLGTEGAFDLWGGISEADRQAGRRTW